MEPFVAGASRRRAMVVTSVAVGVRRPRRPRFDRGQRRGVDGPRLAPGVRGRRPARAGRSGSRPAGPRPSAAWSGSGGRPCLRVRSALGCGPSTKSMNDSSTTSPRRGSRSRCSTPVGLHGFVTRTRSASGSAGSAKPSCALRRIRSRRVPVGSERRGAFAEHGRDDRGAGRGRERGREQPEPFGGAVEQEDAVGSTPCRAARRPRSLRVSSGYFADAPPRVCGRVGQPFRRRAVDDVDREVVVAGPHELVAVERSRGGSRSL